MSDPRPSGSTVVGKVVVVAAVAVAAVGVGLCGEEGAGHARWASRHREET